MPPLVFAGECDVLSRRLADAATGKAFVLMGGDCAETFEGNTADSIRARLKTVLQMSVVLTYAASLPVVKVGRLAGQYFKPRSSLVESRDGVELTSYFGDAVNALAVRSAGPASRSAATRARVQRIDRCAQPRPGLHAGRLRGPASGACVEPGLRSRLGCRPAVRRDGCGHRPCAVVHACLRREPRRVPACRVLRRTRGAVDRLRAGADPDRLAHGPALRRVRPLPVDRRAHPPARRGPRALRLDHPQPDRREGGAHRHSRGHRRHVRDPQSRSASPAG